MRLSSMTSIAVVALALLAAPASASNGPQPSTIGTKGPVSIPVDGDAQTMFRMPSSIAWSLDHRLDIDLFVVYTASKLRNAQNDFEEGTTGFGGSLGFVFAPGRPDEDEEPPAETPVASRFTFGLGVYTDLGGGQGERDRVRFTTYPETVGTRKALQFVTAALNLGFRPTEWLGLGLGLHAIFASADISTLVGGNSTPLAGSPTISGVPVPGNPTYADFLNLFANDGGTDPTTYFECDDFSCVQYSATLSASLRPSDAFGFGVSYRERSWAPEPFEGTAEIDATRTFDRALGTLDPTLRGLVLATLPDRGQNGFRSRYDAELRSLHVPRQVRLSVAAWPLERLLVAGEVAWIEWHRAFGTSRVTLTNGSNRDLNFVVGSDRIDTKLESRWRNTWVVSLYTAFAVADPLTLRFGVAWGESPFNEDRQEGYPTAGFVSTTISAGFGWRVTDLLDVNVLLEYSPETSKQGDASSQAVTARNSTYGSSQLFAHVGVTLRF
jgi:long-subunit fatty acid transport protein